jgi:hypothetical protein
VTDNATPDETPVWFTPPDRGSTPGWPSPSLEEPPHRQASAPDAAAADWRLEELPVAPPAAFAAQTRITGLAPATPIVRPIQTPTAPAPIIREVPPSRPGSPAEPPPEPADDDGGPGWRVRPKQPSAPSRVEGAAGPVEEDPGPTRRGRTHVSAAVAPAAASSADPADVPQMPWDARTIHRPMRRYVLFGVGLFALCGLTAAVLSGVGRSGPAIQQPASIGTLSLTHTPQVDAILQSLEHFEHSAGAVNVATGAYGDGTQPELLLVVAQGGAVDTRGAAAVNAFMRGLPTASSIGWTLDPSKLTTTTVNGTTFVCDSGPASQLDGITLVTCAWGDRGVAGAAIDLGGQPLADTLNEAVEARAAAVH